MTYSADSIHIAAIRLENVYGGKRVILRAQLGSARLRVQVDVAVGDAVSPPPEWLDYPSLLDLPQPRLRAYRPETVIVEKVHAMVVLGTKNSRMRDFFDIYALANNQQFESEILTRALGTTFNHRRTVIPETLPVALTPEFAALREKQTQWRAFLKKSGLASAPGDLGEVTDRLAQFLEPVIHAARTGTPLAQTWKPGGPWRRIESQAGERSQ
jgi:hypothetical protein